MDQNNGGIIGKINTPTTSVASGVWSLDSQFEAQSGSIWPLAFPRVTLANSCRFDDGSSDRLNKTLGTPTNNYKWTYSFWTKRGLLGSEDAITGAINNSQNKSIILFRTDDQLEVMDLQSDSYVMQKKTNRKFRDVSAWYHIVISSDATLSSPATKIYVNGVEETSFATSNEYSQNQANLWNSALANHIGASDSSSRFYDGYLTEFIFVDGQALTPTSFGIFNTVSNIWEPRPYAGTYGNNGFKLNFTDSSNLGDDTSGNGNDFTVNNLTSVDQSTDTCSNNFATWNPLHPGATLFTNCVFADGNLEFESNETGYVVYPIAKSTIGVSSGKWYAEFKPLETNTLIGISDGISNENFIGGSTSNGVAYQNDGQKRVGNSESSYGDSYTTNDIIGVAMDLDNNRVFFSKNGTFQDSGDPTSSTGAITIPTSSTGVFHFATLDSSSSGTSKIAANFGSPAFSISSGNADANGHGNFEYAVPSGYFALCTKNLAEFG